MDVVHLSAHLRRMYDAVFGAAPRGAVLLGNARSPITCSALASCPVWECTTPDNVRRPRHRLRNTPPPRPCQQTRLQRRAAPHLPRAARTCPQPKGAASQPPEMPTTSRTRRPFRSRSSLPPAASASRGWATSPCSCSPPRASPYAWPCRWPAPPGSWPFFCAIRPIPFGTCSKGAGPAHAPRPPCVIRPRASVPYLLVNAQGRIRCSALALRPSRQCKSSTRMRLPPACPACTRCAISDWFRLRATRPRAP